MGRKKIEAGEAYVGLGVRSTVKKGLNVATKNFRAFGAFVGKAGKLSAAAGGSITGAFLGASKVFASAGDELDKMSKRTGVGVETLSRMGFAANRSGADLKDVESSTRGLARTLLNANQGLSTATDTLSELGLTAKDFDGKSVEEQWLMSAEALSKIEDPGKRAAIAMRLFGKSGTSLLPMLEGGRDGMEALFKASDKLGQTLGKDDAESAAKLTDAFGDLTGGIKGIVLQTGAAVAGPLTDFVNQAANITSVVIGWVKNNRELVQTVAAIGVGLLVGGTVLVGAGVAASALAAAIGVVASVIGAILSPIGLMVAGVVGATVAFFMFTETGRSVVDWFIGNFGKLYEKVQSVIEAITTALKGGDLELAGKIAFTGIKLAAAKILKELLGLFGVSMADISESIANVLKKIEQLATRIQSVVEKARGAMAKGLGDFKILRGIATWGIEGIENLDPEDFKKQLADVTRRRQDNARNAIEEADGLDPKELAKSIESALDPAGIDAELEKLKAQAREQAKLRKDETGDPSLSPFKGFPEFAGVASGLKKSHAEFKNFAGLSGRFAARSGAGAKGVEDKILKNGEQQLDKLDDIKTAVENSGGRYS